MAEREQTLRERIAMENMLTGPIAGLVNRSIEDDTKKISILEIAAVPSPTPEISESQITIVYEQDREQHTITVPVNLPADEAVAHAEMRVIVNFLMSLPALLLRCALGESAGLLEYIQRMETFSPLGAESGIIAQALMQLDDVAPNTYS